MHCLPKEAQTSLDLSRRDLMRSVSAAALAVALGVGSAAARNHVAAASARKDSSASAMLADRLDWFLATVNSGGTSLSLTELAENISPDLLELMSPEQIIGLIQSLASGYGKLTLEGATRPRTADQAVALVSAEVGIQVALPIRVESSAPYRITSLNVYPSPAGDGIPLLPEVVDIRSAPVSSLIDIGGRGLYGSLIGTGGPTVVFEAGLTDSAATWAGIIPAVAATTRVFSYDRANTTAGASGAAFGPRTATDAVADLHALLQEADVPAPYVLVGHSVGGIFTRLFASTYPDEVVGMVLVDASHEEQDIRRQALVAPELFAAGQAFLQMSNSEGIDLATSFTEVREARAATPLNPMPLVVLCAGLDNPAFFPDGWPMDLESDLHRELQADLANLVPNGRLVVAEQSGHYIQQSQPDLVVAAIRDVIDAVGRGRSVGRGQLSVAS